MNTYKSRSFAWKIWLPVAAAMLACSGHAADRSGREVVESVCGACHFTGKDGAPIVGDFGAWTKHAEKGLVRLTENAISGVGKMPAHGGQPNLNDLEISRAVAYMVSAGRIADPSKPYASPTHSTGEQLVMSHCVSCHGPGTNGAPKMSDFNAWKPRLQMGIDGLVKSAIAGHNAMPARSGMAKLSDTDLRNAVTYMVVQSATNKSN